MSRAVYSTVALTFLLVACGNSLLGCSRALDPPAPQAQMPTAMPVNDVVEKAAAAPAAAGPAPELHARFSGRVDFSTPNAPRFAWSGTTVVGRFTGTSISARLKDDGKNFFQVLIDGNPQAVIHTDGHKDSYVLASGLAEGTHDVALVRRTEAKLGETTFLGFDTPGTLLTPPPLPDRRIEIIGDSISVGYGNEGPNATCTFNPAEENHYLTYGAITARTLGAEQHTIAWSAQTIGEMTGYFEKTLPQQTDSAWDFKSWIPQVVIMNIGTNNFATYDPTEARYTRIYMALFSRIREVYPNAFIVCVLGPMLTDIYPPGKRNLTLARKYMTATMQKIKDSGEKNFEYIELPEQNHANGLGCGFHPSLKTHQLMADRLVPIVREKMSW